MARRSTCSVRRVAKPNLILNDMDTPSVIPSHSVIPSEVEGSQISPCTSISRDDKSAEVKASSPIRTSLYEREGSMWGSLKRPSRRPTSIVADCRSDDSDLCHEMLTTFGFTEAQMHRASERFHLGRSKSGKTIYWMIDELGICHDGHLGDSWVSTMLKSRYPECAPYIQITHCLFGLHQMSLGSFSAPENEQPAPIGIVESERSAVILSELCPDLLWLAYSYSSNCTVDKFEPLQDHKITFYPRTDPNQECYLSFLELADQVKRTYNIEINVSSFLEDHASNDQKAREIDLLDFMLEK